MKITIFLSSILLAMLSVVILIVIYALTPIQQQTTSYEVQPGITMTALAYDLQRYKVIHHPRRFILLAKLLNVDKKVHVGQYEFAAGTTPLQLLKKITQGKTKQYKITFIEGTTFKQWLQWLHLQPELQHLLSNLSMPAILNRLDIHEVSAEGLLYPDTYYFPAGTTDLDILLQAKQRMKSVLQQEWPHRDNDLPYATPYHALIAASLVEKETADPHERRIIAGILIKRLQKNMLLQFDPSVIYGLGERYQAPLTRDQLRIDTPYNTYLHKGLPPTPIAMPSRESIHAVLNPLTTDYLYFVATRNATHVFSSTLAEHRMAVKQYRRAED